MPANRCLVRDYSPAAARALARFGLNRYLCGRCRGWVGLVRYLAQPHEIPDDPRRQPDSSRGCSGPDGSQTVGPRLDAKPYVRSPLGLKTGGSHAMVLSVTNV